MTTTAVIFDMDGLLLDTERVCLEGFIHARRHFQLTDGHDTFYKCVGLRAEASNQIVRDSLDDKIDFDAFNMVWRSHMSERLEKQVPLKQGVLQLMQLLTAKNIPMGVATSTQTPQARHHLQKAGLLQHLICVIGGDLVTQGKPHPEVYLRVAERLEQAPENCIAFEDSETGTRAAIASGAKTVQIPDLIPPSESFAKHGQLIAPTLLEGAMLVGLISPSDL
jgi:HAD superfamily hydrolase (TIGR01509 family)